ncbi:unnamed protein product [Bursaphelenchus xylophilus]|uniref:(pine wood nematode) hypothetical protein n=1 Tax=Bursaphelenchus xylophilus TaxID=6326 RepID=A0A1I7RTC0_BURXY|nr:unnamed protein product [Bursaphelenchus xylophilus]CAG9122508.1 unnamed protein product [Bursaphelenchus xylophilus]
MASLAIRISLRRISKAVSIPAAKENPHRPPPKPVYITPMSCDEICREYREKIHKMTTILMAAEEKRMRKTRVQAKKQAEFKNLLEEVVCGDSGRSRLISVGSLVTSLAVEDSSDYDFCLLPKDISFYRDFFHNHNFKRVFMDSVMELLSQLQLKDPNLAFSAPPFPLYRAHVPLVCCFFTSGLSIDIQFPDENFHAIRNTNLVRHYAAVDPRFRQLYLYVRALFNRLGIRNSKDGYLSSYHILLLVIHFLQSRTSPPVLPVLSLTHKDKVGSQLPLETLLEMLEIPLEDLIDWKSDNKKSVGQLAIDFMEYYATLDTQTNAIHIRFGKVVKKRQLPGDSRLLMYDPFSKFTVARASKISEALRMGSTYVYNRMCKGQFLDSFPDFPEAEEFKIGNIR